ncbi:hypothetical protein B0O99DRAFT_594090 [Bisporella sp. PMI_857]|nr:hypothetical protein B0O99DRAFT_594090 [Bisporella sp. PMI_857]
MATTLPPDPYKILGVKKEAQLAEIRSAHRKLVLKCHPDKVQDVALKKIKQDEFQKVQQAYEILSDEGKRAQYDAQVKLFALRAEMAGGGKPTARSNPFEYEIRTAEPRPTTFSTSRPPPSPYSSPHSSYPPPGPTSRSHEEEYEIPLRSAKKSASYESADRRRPTTRDGERDRDRSYRDDDRDRERWEKESRRAAHGEKKKSRDKEKRRGAEEKYSRSQPYVEDDEDDYRIPPRKERREDPLRPDERRKEAPLAEKWDTHRDYAAQYMQAARSKAVPVEKEFVAPPLRRAETYAAPPTYNVQHASPAHVSPHSYYPSEDDSPRRSSARSSRRTSDTPQPRSKETSEKEHRRSKGSSRTRDGIQIVEPPSPPTIKTPKMPSHSSSPTILEQMVGREKPSRSKTQEYPRSSERSAMPPLPRAQTFQAGASSGSRLKAELYATDSDSDSPTHHRSPRYSSSPPRRERERERESSKHTKATKYSIIDSKAVPSRHRSELHNVDDGVYMHSRDRSSSRDGRRTTERPSLATRGSSSSRQAPQRSQSQAKIYYVDEKPVIRDARPPMAPRESTTRHATSSGRSPTSLFGEVKYAQAYKPSDVSYSSYAPPTTYATATPVDPYRRGSEPHHGYSYPSRRGPEVYT